MNLSALVLNCTLKRKPETSNTAALAEEVINSLEARGAKTEILRIVDYAIPEGVTTNEGNGDEWPKIHDKILAADILIIASPTWLGHPSSIAQKVLERMDAMITEKDSSGIPVAYNKVAGVVVTGNEDGAHHVISEIYGALIDIGFTIPAQAWTYWNMGPGPGPSYLETDHGHDWSKSTGEAAAANLIAVAKALKARPIPKPPNT